MDKRSECSDAAGEVLGRGGAGSARGRAELGQPLVHVDVSSTAATPNMKIRRAVATRARSIFEEDTSLFFGLGRVEMRVQYEAESRTRKKKSDVTVEWQCGVARAGRAERVPQHGL